MAFSVKEFLKFCKQPTEPIKAIDLGEEIIHRALASAYGDLSIAADLLQVPENDLLLRTRELGINLRYYEIENAGAPGVRR